MADAAIWLIFFNFVTHTSFVLALLYFSSLSIVFLLLFKDIFVKISAHTMKRDLLLIIGAFFLHVATYWICHRFLTAPLELMKHNTASFMQVDRYFIWVKPIDSLLQQLMIIVLVTKLYEQKVSIRTLAILLGVLFGVAHFYSMQHMELGPTALMVFFTTLFALVMPYLLLKVKNGYLYNFMIHIALVDLAALTFWGLFG